MTERTIIPPPELVQQWINEEHGIFAEHLANRAAQWGADQELAACCRQLTDPEWYDEIKNLRGPFRAAELRAARRPKPPSLKEQALEQLDGIAAVFRMSHGGNLVCDTIRRALEQLDD